MDAQLLIGIIGIAYVPVAVAVKMVHATDRELAAVKAANAATFKAISETLTDLKSGQTHTNDKLDRLVERFL